MRPGHKMCRPLAVDGTCTSTADWVCPGDDANAPPPEHAAGHTVHEVAKPATKPALEHPSAANSDHVQPKAGLLPRLTKHFGMIGLMAALATSFMCAAGCLFLFRVYMLRRRLAHAGGKGGPRAMHTRVSSKEDAMPGARDAHGDDEEGGRDIDGDDEILGDDEVNRPSSRSFYSGGMPLPDDDEIDESKAAPSMMTDRAEPNSPGPLAKDDEDELLKRVAALLKDQPPAGGPPS